MVDGGCPRSSGEAGHGGGGSSFLGAREAGLCPLWARAEGEVELGASLLGRTVLGEATGMAWAHGQGTATAVAWRGRSWRPSRGSGTHASRPCSQRGRLGGKPWALEGGLGRGMVDGGALR